MKKAKFLAGQAPLSDPISSANEFDELIADVEIDPLTRALLALQEVEITLGRAKLSDPISADEIRARKVNEDPGLPLGFFDAQIRCGDALLGVFDLTVLEEGIPDAAFKPLTGDDRDTARYYLQANRAATSGQGGFDFGTGQAAMPEMKPMALDFSGFRDLP
ncbi:hypothetical protein [Ruegeria atlantica]|uniref:Uncharacterized protein n=1 Tax=Ruegeria atlantica TaxID=81569 RepID=A0A0P1EB87_9RHOB|nr:hypothetical protein [Ruegeria atlantica]CUH46714.1 hypothetical protein RUA4292_00880 [Ruegeria atlantica]